jgi:hypothetical protein
MATGKKADKSKRKTAKKSTKTQMAKRGTRKTEGKVAQVNESQLRVAMDRETAPVENNRIEDTGAVQEARSSIENVIDDAKKTVGVA